MVCQVFLCFKSHEFVVIANSNACLWSFFFINCTDRLSLNTSNVFHVVNNQTHINIYLFWEAAMVFSRLLTFLPSYSWQPRVVWVCDPRHLCCEHELRPVSDLFLTSMNIEQFEELSLKLSKWSTLFLLMSDLVFSCIVWCTQRRGHRDVGEAWVCVLSLPSPQPLLDPTSLIT